VDSVRCSVTARGCSSRERSTDANDIRRLFVECGPDKAPDDEHLLPVHGVCTETIGKQSSDAVLCSLISLQLWGLENNILQNVYDYLQRHLNESKR